MTAERALSFVDTNVLVYAFEKGSSPLKSGLQGRPKSAVK